MVSSNPDNVGLRSYKDSAKFLGIGLSKLYQLIKAGEVDLVKLGPRTNRITQESLDRFVNARKISNRE